MSDSSPLYDDVVTTAFSHFVANADYDSLPKEAVEQLGWFVLDAVANVIAGAQTRIAHDQSELLATWVSSGDVRPLGTRATTILPFGVYLNASAANQLDFDDTYATFAHPGATTIGPAFALACATPTSGKELLAAIAVGYEVQVRIMSAGMPSPERRRTIAGFGTWQGLGSAAVAAKMMRLSADRVRHAFGLAAFNAPLPSFPKLGLADERPGTSVKNNYGWSAMGGVLGTIMAARGARGNAQIFDGPSGFWVMAGSDRFDESVALDGLGERYLFPATSTKPYAACRWSHSSLDVAADLREQLAPGETVESIEVDGFGELVRCLSWVRPVDMVDAQFSLPHLVALELLGKSCRHGLDDADLADPQVHRLADRMTLRHDSSLDAGFNAGRLPVRMTLRTSSGRLLSADRPDAWGTAAYPFSRENSWSKYLDLVSPVIGADRAIQLGEKLLGLDRIQDVTELIDIARP